MHEAIETIQEYRMTHGSHYEKVEIEQFLA